MESPNPDMITFSIENEDGSRSPIPQQAPAEPFWRSPRSRRVLLPLILIGNIILLWLVFYRGA